MKKIKNKSEAARQRRKKHIRKVIYGTADRPRLVVYRSTNQIYAQLIDDQAGAVIGGVSSLTPELKKKATKLEGKVAISKLVGQAVAELAKGKGIKSVVFDRNGFLYHGRVKAVADGARDGGLQF